MAWCQISSGRLHISNFIPTHYILALPDVCNDIQSSAHGEKGADGSRIIAVRMNRLKHRPIHKVNRHFSESSYTKIGNVFDFTIGKDIRLEPCLSVL